MIVKKLTDGELASAREQQLEDRLEREEQGSSGLRLLTLMLSKVSRRLTEQPSGDVLESRGGILELKLIESGDEESPLLRLLTELRLSVSAALLRYGLT